jgi:hypothetical protein
MVLWASVRPCVSGRDGAGGNAKHTLFHGGHTLRTRASGSRSVSNEIMGGEQVVTTTTVGGAIQTMIIECQTQYVHWLARPLALAS